MKLKDFFKNLRSEKGLSGADVAGAITIILLTIGVVTAIYVNTTNKSKESIRYSAATRIATQISENIQARTYDELVYRCGTEAYYKSTVDSDGNIFGVKVSTGYSATVTASKVSGAQVDVIRDVQIDVSYLISNTTKTITLKLTKEKELLGQTNPPDLNLLDDYSDSTYCAIKKVGDKYVITATSDPDWYNYDKGVYALILKTSKATSAFNTEITSSDISSGTLYAWVPRFGINGSTVEYCYGTSNYKISFANSSNLYGYMLSGTGNNGNYTVKTVTGLNSSFSENDGLSGIWYAPIKTSENTTEETNAYTAFSGKVTKTNF